MALLVAVLAAVGLGRVQESARASGEVDVVTRLARFTFTTPGAALDSGFVSGRRFLSRVGNVNHLYEENQRLRALAKAAETSTAKEDARQNELASLRGLVGLPDYGRTRLAAHVIGYVPAENRMRLSVGKRRGVAPGLPVVAADGLVGQVTAVEDGTCDVTLLVSPTLRVSALLESDRRFAGILRGETPQRLVMDVADPNVVLRPGDAVVTSGLSEYYPRGIVIGYVVEFKENRDFGVRRAHVSPRVRFEDLTEVFVLR